MSRLIIYLAVAFTFCGLNWMPAAEPELKTDPIAGEWRWNGNKEVLIDPDGTAREAGGKGKWKLLEATTTVERKYEFIWKKDDGKVYIDTMILSGDKNRLEGRNQSNRRVWAKRIP